MLTPPLAPPTLPPLSLSRFSLLLAYPLLLLSLYGLYGLYGLLYGLYCPLRSPRSPRSPPLALARPLSIYVILKLLVRRR